MKTFRVLEAAAREALGLRRAAALEWGAMVQTAKSAEEFCGGRGSVSASGGAAMLPGNSAERLVEGSPLSPLRSAIKNASFFQISKARKADEDATLLAAALAEKERRAKQAPTMLRKINLDGWGAKKKKESLGASLILQ